MRLATPGPWVFGLILPLTLGVAWEVAVRHGLISGRLMPPPSRLADSAWALIRSGEMTTHVLATLWRVAIGFACGAAAGTVLGIVKSKPFQMRTAVGTPREGVTASLDATSKQQASNK